MAIAVLGGLIVSTVLSLYVVPAFYVSADRAKRWLRRIRKLPEEDFPVATTNVPAAAAPRPLPPHGPAVPVAVIPIEPVAPAAPMPSAEPAPAQEPATPEPSTESDPPKPSS